MAELIDWDPAGMTEIVDRDPREWPNSSDGIPREWPASSQDDWTAALASDEPSRGISCTSAS